MTIHYELILLYACGFTPKDCIRNYGYSRGSAYRFYRIYRIAGKRLTAMLAYRNSDTPEREHKSKKLDALRKKKGRPPSEKKPCLILNKETGQYDEVLL